MTPGLLMDMPVLEKPTLANEFELDIRITAAPETSAITDAATTAPFAPPAIPHAVLAAFVAENLLYGNLILSNMGA